VNTNLQPSGGDEVVNELWQPSGNRSMSRHSRAEDRVEVSA